MPINIPNDLPATEVLNNENIFIMHEDRATSQDIRPLRIVIFNLMPEKIVTETQFLRLLGNSPLQVDIVLLHPKTHKSKNTSPEHLLKFYCTIDDIKEEKFDGMIITGAPVELLDFEEISYWEELKEVMNWSHSHVYSTLHICMAAQAGLYHHFGIPKYPLDKKMFGVFTHTINKKNVPLLRGFDDEFLVPHSRYTGVRKEDIEKVAGLEILSESRKAGVYLVATRDGRQIFLTGHPEYDPLSLKKEYLRDKKQGLEIEIPKAYFPDDDPGKPPVVRWRGHANLLFSNWLNYHVYQETPYNLDELKAK